MLQAINAPLTNKLDSLSDTIGRLQGELFDLQENNNKLTKELEDYRQRETKMKSQVEEAKFKAKLAEQRSNQNEQILDCGIRRFSSFLRNPAKPRKRQRKVRRKRCMFFMTCLV